MNFINELIKDYKPERFIAIIRYDGTSLDPLEIYIKSGMTDTRDLKTDGLGHVGVSFREIPAASRDRVIEIAEKIAQFENDKAELQEVLATYSSSVVQLKSQVKEAEKTIKENQRQLSMVKSICFHSILVIGGAHYRQTK